MGVALRGRRRRAESRPIYFEENQNMRTRTLTICAAAAVAVGAAMLLAAWCLGAGGTISLGRGGLRVTRAPVAAETRDGISFNLTFPSFTDVTGAGADAGGTPIDN
jgi:hypothetical protein